MLNHDESAIPPEEKELVLSSLDREQLVEARRRQLPRRRLTRRELLLLWALRIYLLFMITVVIYQAWHSAR